MSARKKRPATESYTLCSEEAGAVLDAARRWCRAIEALAKEVGNSTLREQAANAGRQLMQANRILERAEEEVEVEATLPCDKGIG